MVRQFAEVKKLEDLIQRLDAWLRTNHPSFYAQLAPGLSDAELLEWENSLGLTLPNDFKLFYKWKNGQVEPDDSLVFSLGLMQADAIVDFYQMMTQDLHNTFWSEYAWQKGWIPFLNDYTANRYCIDLKGSTNGKIGQVISIWSDEIGSDRIFMKAFINGWKLLY